jgi:hypothetical protein
MKHGPEEDWENRKLWEDEKRFDEEESERLTPEEISSIKADEKYDADR